ncbi:paraneoplastic antigen Ma2 homolog [Bombina bombina]|uniref:paraneoplastic antigen Ma2 homolog n=1 Tax=Bombina bombina TaxID=8345 RepID=UPI00235AA167|nr:paraneoplastic antigen Ma2 homolog [Bombina bombina]
MNWDSKKCLSKTPVPSPRDVREWARIMRVPPQKVVAVQTPIGLSRRKFIDALKLIPGLENPDIVQAKKTGTHVVTLVQGDQDINPEKGTTRIPIPGADPKGCLIVYPEGDSDHEQGDDSDLIFQNSDSESEDDLNVNDSEGSSIVSERRLKNDSPKQEISSSITNALKKLVVELTQAQHIHNYKRLKIFSGIDPTPVGEECFKSWRDTTLQLLREWACSEDVKRQRLIEGLKGPALDLVRHHQIIHPQASASELLQIIMTAYAEEEDEFEWRKRYANTIQVKGEKLSAYVVRVELIVGTLVEKGIIPASEIDKYRCKQLLRGTLPGDSCAATLENLFMY